MSTYPKRTGIVAGGRLQVARRHGAVGGTLIWLV